MSPGFPTFASTPLLYQPPFISPNHEQISHQNNSCWDGKNLDSPDHTSHIAYPSTGTFESNGPCPATHPVKIPQLFYEVIWDTTKFNDKSLWPETGQPFVWSQGDETGFGSHGDYIFGWKDNALQKAMDANCNVNCPQLKTQSIAVGNKCTKESQVREKIDGCKCFLSSPSLGVNWISDC